MASLKDFLSDDSKEQLIASTAVEGTVYRMHLGIDEGVYGKNVGDEGRNKYFIVIGHDSDGNALGIVLIDTEINQHLPPERKELHYPLDPAKYAFLEGRLRYVDCSDFKTISLRKFTEMFAGKKEKGTIDSADLTNIKSNIRSYKNVSIKLLRRFGFL